MKIYFTIERMYSYVAQGLYYFNLLSLCCLRKYPVPGIEFLPWLRGNNLLQVKGSCVCVIVFKNRETT